MEERSNPGRSWLAPGSGQAHELRPQAPRRLTGWPLTFLLLGLAVVLGFYYTVIRLADMWGEPDRAGEESVAVLHIESEITDSLWVTEALANYADDPNVMAVVFRIDSPGGAVAPCQEIYEAIRRFEKPVVASMGSVAASGGLYIATAADHVLANPGTLTGSIGVIMETVEASGAMEKIGVSSQAITSGRFKDTGSPFRPMREDERKLLEDMVLRVYEQFVKDVAVGRDLEITEVRPLADGRIFNGEEALENGLIDQIGGFEDAIMKAAEMANIEGRPTLFYEDGRGPWWRSALSGALGLPELPSSLKPGISLKYALQ